MSARRHTLAALEAALCSPCAWRYARASEAREAWGTSGSLWWVVWCDDTRRTCRVCGPLVRRYQRRTKANARREAKLRAGRDVRRDPVCDGPPRSRIDRDGPQPSCWLKRCERYRAQGYDLCARRAEWLAQPGYRLVLWITKGVRGLFVKPPHGRPIDPSTPLDDDGIPF